MRISLNWLKKYVDIKIPTDELIRRIGARLVEVEAVIDETHKYDNIYVVRVAEAEKIPDTHLTLCQIDVGRKDLVQVVCGAPNVHEGMLAAWIAPGAIVPASVHEDAPFVIGKRKMLKKYESNGMLAGADELDFDDKHEKIAEIDPAIAKPGDLLSDVFDLRDQILDIENKSLTHRPDCFGVIGFAREVAGILGQKFVEPKLTDITTSQTADSAKHPSAHSKKSQASDSALSISIANPDICSRYSALILKKHGELKHKYLTVQDILLAKSGMRPIDPIVDATNFYMLLTGQPLHAFDYDKFIAAGQTKLPHIGVRLAKAGEKLLLLDGEQIDLSPDDIIITSGDVPVALAGAMGGESTAIDQDTKNIILESATFSLYHLRKTQMAHGIFSEAITRFTKGQPPYQTLAVAEACAQSLSSGFQVSAVVDEYPHPAPQTVVKITTDEINDLLGTDYSVAKITKTLENVGLSVTANPDSPVINVQIPAWRTDLHIPEDIIEEVGRLLGYDNITPVLPLHQTAEINPMLTFKREIRHALRRLGASEVLTYSFVSGKLLENAHQDPANSYRIVNSISPELQYVRQTLTPSLLDKAYLNQKIPFDKFALFEMNKVYQKSWGLDAEKVPVEKIHLALVLAERKNSGTAYYKAKQYLERLLAELHISATVAPFIQNSAQTKAPAKNSASTKASAKVSAPTKTSVSAQVSAVAAPYETLRSGLVKNSAGHVLGVVGEFKNSVRYNFKLAPYLAGFELELDAMLPSVDSEPAIYLGPREKRDLTVVTSKSYAALIDEITKVLAKADLSAEITPLGIYQPEKSASSDQSATPASHISVHLEFHAAHDDPRLAKVMSKLEKLS